jgi:hypothetical protein
MKRATLVSIILLLCVPFSLNSMLKEFDPHRQKYTDQPAPYRRTFWIKTKDEKKFPINITKDLPISGLQFLLKQYNGKFGRYNRRKNPLKVGFYLADYKLLIAALNAINHDMSQWHFTQKELITLFQLAAALRIPSLYAPTLDSYIKDNIAITFKEISQHIVQFLPGLNKEIYTPYEAIMMFTTKPIEQIEPIKEQPKNKDDLFIRNLSVDCKNGCFIFTIKTKENIELYSKTFTRKDISQTSSLLCDSLYEQINPLLSNNNRYAGISYLKENKSDIITINQNDLTVTTKTIDGHCDYINDDGSFYTHTPHAIRFHRTGNEQCTLLYSAPRIDLSTVTIIPDQHCIKYTYCSKNEPYKKLEACIPIHKQKMYKNIQHAVEHITPLQYMLVSKACNKTRKPEETMSIKTNSLDHYTLQSFKRHQPFIAKTLNLQITDK